MASANLRQRARKEIEIYLGVLPLLFGAMDLPFITAGLRPNFAFVSPSLVAIGILVLILSRVSLDTPALLAKRVIGAFAFGLATGYFAFEIAWAELLHSWYEYATASLGYVFVCWCILRFVNLRVDEWRH